MAIGKDDDKEMGDGEMTDVIIERLRFVIQQGIDSLLLDGTEVSAVEDYMRNSIVVSVRGYVWGEAESVQRQEVRFPRDWRQAFKGRWFPKWALSHWPVEETVVVLDVRALYPEFRPAIPGQAARLVIERQDLSTENADDEER